MLKEDYWLELKYYISGLKLLVEISSEDEISRKTVLDRWFGNEDVFEDELYEKLYRTAEKGIRENKATGTVIKEMIDIIPQGERFAFDSMGYTFSTELMDNSYEKIYSETEHKYKWRRVYEGLLPGNEYIGLMFADLAYRHSPSVETGAVEAYCDIIGMISWGKILSDLSEDDIAVIASDMSRQGRLFLLAGLQDDRVHEVIKKSVLLEKNAHDSADSVAKKLMNRIIHSCYHLHK